MDQVGVTTDQSTCSIFDAWETSSMILACSLFLVSSKNMLHVWIVHDLSQIQCNWRYHLCVLVCSINGLDTNADWHSRNKCLSVFKDKTTSCHGEKTRRVRTRGRVSTTRHIHSWLARQDKRVDRQRSISKSMQSKSRTGMLGCPYLPSKPSSISSQIDYLAEFWLVYRGKRGDPQWSIPVYEIWTC